MGVGRSFCPGPTCSRLPWEVERRSQDGNKYRILDRVHRLQAYKEIGATEIPVHIITLIRMSHLGFRQERITQSLSISQQVISHHLQKMLMWANFVNTELKKGFNKSGFFGIDLLIYNFIYLLFSKGLFFDCKELISQLFEC